MSKRKASGAPVRVVGYVRVSTEEQADSGAGLAAQCSALESEAERRDWQLVRVEKDAGTPGRSLEGRPGLDAALARIEAGEADALAVAKLDRLSRSLLDFCQLMERARRKGWALVALDLGVDTSTPAGELMANVLATFAQFERRLIGQRTREAMAEKRRQGVHLGRPATLPAAVLERIHAERRAGQSLAAIARELNADGVATAHGGRAWWPSTVSAVLHRR